MRVAMGFDHVTTWVGSGDHGAGSCDHMDVHGAGS